MPGLNLRDVRRLPVPIAPLAEQEELESMIATAIASVANAKVQVAESESALTQLDQSILAKAFRGELVPQDPRDEPASELLARIRTTREAQATNKPRKRTKRAASASTKAAASSEPKEPDPPAVVEKPEPQLTTSPEAPETPPESLAPGEDPELAYVADDETDSEWDDESEDAAEAPRRSIESYESSELMAVIREVFNDGDARYREDAIIEMTAELGYLRLTQRVREVVDNSIRTAVRRGILANEHGQLWLVGQHIIDFTLDQQVESFLTALGTSWCDQENAIRFAAYHLGYRRTGSKIQKAFKSAINAAIRRGLLERDGQELRRIH